MKKVISILIIAAITGVILARTGLDEKVFSHRRTITVTECNIYEPGEWPTYNGK